MNEEAFTRLLSAARALLEAARGPMVPREEWEALSEATAAALEARTGAPEIDFLKAEKDILRKRHIAMHFQRPLAIGSRDQNNARQGGR